MPTKNKKMTIEDLAKITLKGFERVDKRFDEAAKRVDDLDRATDERLLALETRVNDGFDNVTARLTTMEHDIAHIRSHFVYRNEFEDVLTRLKLLERKIGIKSGK